MEIMALFLYMVTQHYTSVFAPSKTLEVLTSIIPWFNLKRRTYGDHNRMRKEEVKIHAINLS
jgi:hypothetical protein